MEFIPVSGASEIMGSRLFLFMVSGPLRKFGCITLRPLPNNIGCIPDLPGFGRSEKPASSFTPSDYISFIDDFRKALNVDQVSLIGQSLGGGIALHYTLQFSEKVDKLVLVDGAGLGKEVIWTLRLMSLPWIGELISHPSRIGVALFF